VSHPSSGTSWPYDELGADHFTRRLDSDRETSRLIARPLGHQVNFQAAA
jgi:hypothetical protein